jgi:hypothetical protein
VKPVCEFQCKAPDRLRESERFVAHQTGADSRMPIHAQKY